METCMLLCYLRRFYTLYGMQLLILLYTRLPVTRWVKLSLNFESQVSSLALNIINLNYLNSGL